MGIKHRHTLDVEVVGVVLIKHCRRKVRAVFPCIALAGDVNFAAVEVKCVEEILPETHEVLRQVHFIDQFGRCVWRGWRESSANWLVHIDLERLVY